MLESLRRALGIEPYMGFIIDVWDLLFMFGINLCLDVCLLAIVIKINTICSLVEGGQKRLQKIFEVPRQIPRCPDSLLLLRTY